MSKLNWNKCKKPGAAYGSKRQLALKLQRKDQIKATEKQKSYMSSLGIDYPENVTKRQAMHLISSTLDKIRAFEANLAKEIQYAMDRDK